MIHYSYAAFRQAFAVRARTSAVSLRYAAGIPATIIRTTGSFITDGFLTGHSVDIVGTTLNSARVTIDEVNALTMTLAEGENLTDEGFLVSSLIGSFYENDGAEQWPRDLVRANGFEDTIVVPEPTVSMPLSLTCNGGLTDAADADSYDWYVSQRSEEPLRRYFNVTQLDVTKSGSIRLALGSVAQSELGIIVASTLTAATRPRVFAKVYVFCRRASDGAIQIVDMLRASNAEASVV